MGYIFEIYNRQGEMTKRGAYTKSGMEIIFSEDDYRYVVRKDYSPFEKVEEGSAKRIRKFRGQTEPLAKLCFLSKNHAEFVIDNENAVYHLSGEEKKLINPNGHLKIKREPGLHVFTNLSNNRKSSFRLFEDDKEKVLKNISFTKEQQELIKDIIFYTSDSISTHESLLNYGKIIKGAQSTLSLYHMIKQLERVENARLRFNSKSKWHLYNDIGCEIVDDYGEIDRVRVYKIVDGEKIYHDSFDISEKNSIHLDEYTAILVEAYKNGRFVSSQIGSMVPHSIKKIIWESKQASKNAYVSAIERGAFSPETAISDAITELVLIENSIATNSFIDEPTVVSIENEYVEFSIYDIGLLKSIGSDFYLTLSRAVDALGVKRVYRKKIESKAITIDLMEDGLSFDEDLFVWIEDQNGVIVSEVNILFADDEEGEKRNAYEQYWHEKYEEIVLSDIDPILRQNVKRHISESSLLDAGKMELAKESLVYLEGTGLWNHGWKTLRTVIEKMQTNVSSKFFEDEIVYNNDTRILSFPNSERRYVAIIHQFYSTLNGYFDKYRSDTSEVALNGNYAIVRFIDINSYEMSGFAMFDVGKGSLVSVDKINVRVI